MANDDGTFGFEELEKAFRKVESRYENKTDAMLMSLTNLARQRIRSKTPSGRTKKLKGSWRTKKPKTFGKARVARVQTENRYGHVVEEGHKVVRGGTARGRNVLQRAIRGISVGGMTKGEKMIADSMKELEGSFNKSAEQLLADLTKEVEL